MCDFFEPFKRKKAQKNPPSAGASRGALREPSRQGAAWTGSAAVSYPTYPTPPAGPLRGRLRRARSRGSLGFASAQEVAKCRLRRRGRVGVCVGRHDAPRRSMKRVLHVRWHTDRKKYSTGDLPLTNIHTQWSHWNLECLCVNTRLMLKYSRPAPFSFLVTDSESALI